MRSRVVLTPLLAGAAALAACSAKLDDAKNRTTSDGGLDAPGDGPDVPADMPPDVAPVDCAEGGDARAIDSTTNTCLRYFSTPLLWQEAQDACAALTPSANLVVIKSPETNAAVDAVAPTRAWIGATDTVTENTFVWLDGTPLNAGYTNWRTDEPNNQGPADSDEDCAQIENGGTWDDRTCVLVGEEGPYPYVCQTAGP